ncbi:MAG: hypothetical protein JRN21_09380 [Nitrososphaerota archaeon]|nr:hypothetical protein [Nitrososphaerota archaeon]
MNKELIENGFPEAFLDDITIMMKTMMGETSTEDVSNARHTLEKLSELDTSRFPKMGDLLDQYVSELTGVDVCALRKVAEGVLKQ